MVPNHQPVIGLTEDGKPYSKLNSEKNNIQKKQPSVTLWLFNIAMENGPFIDALPINSMVIFHGYVKLPDGKMVTSDPAAQHPAPEAGTQRAHQRGHRRINLSWRHRMVRCMDWLKPCFFKVETMAFP